MNDVYTLEVKTKIIDNKFLYLSFDKGKSYELVGTLENKVKNICDVCENQLNPEENVYLKKGKFYHSKCYKNK